MCCSVAEALAWIDDEDLSYLAVFGALRETGGACSHQKSINQNIIIDG